MTVTAALNTSLNALPTPALLLDTYVLSRNCAAMSARAKQHGVRLRPHLKTSKSADVAKLATQGHFGGITVSTIAEVEYFAASGFDDITYGVGIDASKIDKLAAIQREHGTRITLLTDQLANVELVDTQAVRAGATFPVMIEIDTGGGRGGLAPDSADLACIAEAIRASTALKLEGVLTHAGHSYHVEGTQAISDIAEAERAGAVHAAQALRAAGFSVPVVSVGSTPTAVCAKSLEGVTELRPGVYTFFDLDQAARGICTYDDIALTVIATVIGHNPRSQRVLIDAGALALSKDTSGAEFRSDLGYGLVCHAQGGTPLANIFVAELHQEHGLIATSADVQAMFDALPVGARVRILPHHACMTAAPFDRYHLVTPGTTSIQGIWRKTRGW